MAPAAPVVLLHIVPMCLDQWMLFEAYNITDTWTTLCDCLIMFKYFFIADFKGWFMGPIFMYL